MTEVVFVHGALVRDGAWWWHPTAELLARHGVRSRSVALPTTGDAAPAGGDLHDDADALRAELDRGGDALVVAHSYGGTVVADAGAHPAMRGLVLVSSYLPEPGDAQGAIMADEPDPVAVAARADGAVEVAGYDLERFAARFLQDGDAAMQREAWARVVPQSLGAFTTAVRATRPTDLDVTALVCTDDRSTSVALQRRHAARATRSLDLPTGHHPFLTRPDLVAEIVGGLVGAAGGSGRR